MNDCRYAFRIVGSPEGGKRRLVDAVSSLSAYALCDSRCETDRESYLSCFWFGEEFRSYINVQGGTAGFNGVCWSPRLWFDIDRAGDLATAQRDTIKLCAFLRNRYGIAPDDMLIFFSGGKGFHCGVPLDSAPSGRFHDVCRGVATEISYRSGVQIDGDIYKKVQPFRAPNSRHPKTGFHKRHLTLDRLNGWTIERIKTEAEQPQPFQEATQPMMGEPLRELWASVVVQGDKQTLSAGRQSLPSDRERLNRATMDFIREGATENRTMRLFSASANLAEFGCPYELAFALLEEAGLDSGLPGKEVRRVIDGGLKGGV